jgi:hypothetical protein
MEISSTIYAHSSIATAGRPVGLAVGQVKVAQMRSVGHRKFSELSTTDGSQHMAYNTKPLTVLTG